MSHAAAKSLQSCPTLCDPIDGSPLGSPVPGILQTRNWSGLPFPSHLHTKRSGGNTHATGKNIPQETIQHSAPKLHKQAIETPTFFP